MERNAPWQRDELILALDLYFRHNPAHISKSHPEVLALSKTLGALPIHPERADPRKWRNINGVYMKLCNFLPRATQATRARACEAATGWSRRSGTPSLETATTSRNRLQQSGPGSRRTGR